MKITVFQDVSAKIPFYTTIDKALERIKDKSKIIVEQVRLEADRDKRNLLKEKLSRGFSDRANPPLYEKFAVYIK